MPQPTGETCVWLATDMNRTSAALGMWQSFERLPMSFQEHCRSAEFLNPLLNASQCLHALHACCGAAAQHKRCKKLASESTGKVIEGKVVQSAFGRYRCACSMHYWDQGEAESVICMSPSKSKVTTPRSRVMLEGSKRQKEVSGNTALSTQAG